MLARPPSAIRQAGTLAHTFLARFFENENTAGRGDLRDSFFWLIAALATPGIVLPCYQQFHWTLVYNYGGGLEALRAYALCDKAVYLTLTSAAIGLLSAVTWNVLLVDRRDGLILGSLPVNSWSILRMPPMWFLGLYETILGTPLDVMHGLARTAATALGAVALLVAVTYPIACRRVLTAAVQGGTEATHGWTRVLAAKLTATLSRTGPDRAALQFYLATAGRVGQHRLLLSIVVGAGLAFVVPTALYWATSAASALPERPVASLLSLPLVVVFFTTVALRVTMAVPSELSARWVFDAASAAQVAGRSAARRILFALGVMPPLLVAAWTWTRLWGARTAAWHLAASLLASLVVTEMLRWGFASVPCAQPLAPSRLNLQARWPLYVLGLLVFCFGVPGLEIIASRRTTGFVTLLAALAAVLFFVRRGSDRDAWMNIVTGDPQGLLILDLAGAIRNPARAEKSADSLLVQERP